MDTVVGRPGGKVLMTFTFTVCTFTFAILMENKNASEATSAIHGIKDRLGRAGFFSVRPFPCY